MAGTIGNKNAEKYPEDVMLKIIDDMQKYIIEDDCHTLKRALRHVKKHTTWWAEMTEKFIDNKIVSQAIKETEDIIEDNIIENTMDGTAKSAVFSIFLLKNKFGYKDKSEQDVNQTITPVKIVIENEHKAD